MASQSEKTFGARIYNAEQLSTNLAAFVGYIAVTPETTVIAYNELIDETAANNTLIAAAESQFNIAVDTRQDLFRQGSTSMHKTLSPILSYIKAKFGKNSPQAEKITALINNIRGESTQKLKRNEEGEFVSNSHRSFGSQTQYFSDIIATLTSYGTAYAPTNPSISLENLNLQLAALIHANTQVTTTYGVLKPLKDSRLPQYQTLSQRSQTIKETVKSQYGYHSSEYKLIKGYRI